MFNKDNDTLRTCIEEVIGHSIQYAKDCERLSDDIFLFTGEKISSTTLRRFFEIMPTKSQPSRYTIDTLEKYLDEKSNNVSDSIIESNSLSDVAMHCDQMIDKYEGINEQLASWLMGSGMAFTALLAYLSYLLPKVVKQGNVRFIFKLYNGPEHVLEQNALFSTLGKVLQSNDQTNDSIIQELAKHPKARLYFFERYVAVGNFQIYGKWLKHYLKHEKHPLKILWAKSLLSWGKVLAGQKPDEGALISLFEKHESQLKHAHPFIQARIYGIGLSVPALVSKCETKIHKLIHSEIESLKTNNLHTPLFSFMILSYLLFHNEQKKLDLLRRVFYGYQGNKKTEHDFSLWYLRKLLDGYLGKQISFSKEEVASISIGFTDENYMVKYAGSFFIEKDDYAAEEIRSEVIDRSGFKLLTRWQPKHHVHFREFK